ncbi:hypothetical protein [Shimia sagamensis]|uniref:Uncharacterized protein n=1 Tax=Shimia sagamensis TaxID=1566352 RepID=A0ABY1P0P7_9RHOB|nr:hypothetical protein [Shimia sagamensis]SMP23505.1 hypothetical protein SAMN06265373_104375 [Shimia sagamensis]
MSEIPKWVRPTAIVAALFGALTVFSGGMVLFGNSAAKAAAGDAVPLVLWFNFLAGFAYILGAFALVFSTTWGLRASWVIGIGTFLIFTILIAMALNGTAFEWRTIGAMSLRSGFWLAIAIALTKRVRKRTQ